MGEHIDGVALYHCRVQEATRQVNRLRAEARMLGIKIPAAALREKAERETWLSALKNQDMAKRLAVLWLGLEASCTQAQMSKQAYFPYNFFCFCLHRSIHQIHRG